MRWSIALSARPRSGSLARESHRFLVWDDQNWLTLMDASGRVQGKVHGKGLVSAVAAADDGSGFAAVGTSGEVWWLAPDLTPRWEVTLPASAVSVAMDAFAYYLAASDSRGNLHIFDRQSQTIARMQTPRAIHHLAFVPERDCLIAAADFGLVMAFDLKGRCLWQDRLFAHLGSLAVDGLGERVAFACFTDGLRFYNRQGKVSGTVMLSEPCRLAAMSYDGDRLLVGGLEARLHLLDRSGSPRVVLSIPAPAVTLALGPLAEYALVGLADGRILGVDLPTS